MILTSIALFVHLLAFAAFVGAGFAQTRMLDTSARSTVPAVRDLYEQLAKFISTRIELPAITLSVISGGLMLIDRPELAKSLHMHIKFGAVGLLLVLAHLEMFNLIKINRLRKANGEAADTDIAKLKARHGVYGLIGGLATLTVLVMIVLVRTGAGVAP